MRRYLRFLIPAALLAVVLVVLLVSLSQNLVFFHTPTEVMEGGVDAGPARVRVGGQVATGSVISTADGVTFDVTDGRESIPVVHRGAPQDLFQEGIGVVVEGTWDGTAFRSDTMLIKHDEQYRSDDGVYETPGDGSTAP